MAQYPLWAIATALVCYLIPGIFGHGPWKQDETYTFGIIDHMLRTGAFLVPTNAGQPFMEKPPLFYWTAYLFARAFGGLCSPHEAARLASAFFSLITFGFAARTLQRIGNHPSLTAAPVVGATALMAGSLLVLKHVHDMFTDVALLAATSVAFYALHRIAVRSNSEPGRAVPAALPLLLGVSLAAAMMSKGVFVPGLFLCTMIGMPCVIPALRQRTYIQACGMAVLVAVPLSSIWPLLLWRESTPLFMSWFWDNNIGRFIGFSVPELGAGNDKRFFILRSALSTTFPLGILALVGFARGGWRHIREPHIALSVMFTAVGLSVLSLSATARQLYLLPFALPLAVLATRAVESAPPCLNRFWDWISRGVFGLLAFAIWGAWWLMQQPISAHGPLHFLGRVLPLDYVLPFSPIQACAAVALTAAWLLLLSRLHEQPVWRGALSWCIGATLVWGLIFTLLLPWLDKAKSYEAVFIELGQRIDEAWRPDDCMASVNLGESEAPMLLYYAGILHQPVESARQTQCRWLVVETRGESRALEWALNGATGWTPIWQGARQGDHDEKIILLQRIGS